MFLYSFSTPRWQRLGCGIAVLVFLASCTDARQALNSDRILDTFGSYGVEILHADAWRRTSNLYSDDGAAGHVCRTYALVEFNTPVDERLVPQQQRISAGESIGQVFRDAGWRIDKVTVSIRLTRPSDYDDDVAGLMRIDPQTMLATHRYRFDVSKDGVRIRYATITEVHHPEYLTVQQLKRIYD